MEVLKPSQNIKLKDAKTFCRAEMECRVKSQFSVGHCEQIFNKKRY